MCISGKTDERAMKEVEVEKVNQQERHLVSAADTFTHTVYDFVYLAAVRKMGRRWDRGTGNEAERNISSER